MTVLIFGAGGQDAHYLGGLCSRLGEQVTVCARSTGSWTRADVSDRAAVADLIDRVRPGYVFHLAAKSTTRHEAMFENQGTILDGAINILDAVEQSCPDAKVFLAGSGVQFRNEGRPISELDEFEAGSAYAVARIGAVYTARYFRSRGLKVYVGYLFHHESPYRKPGHVSRLIASAAARIARGSDETLELGDVRVEKEWTFAGDVVEAIWLLVNQERMFEVAIGSGQACSIQSWLESCFAHVDLDWRKHVRLREGFVAEYPRLVSEPSKIRSLGWAPKVNMQQLAAMMVSAECDRLAGAGAP